MRARTFNSDIAWWAFFGFGLPLKHHKVRCILISRPQLWGHQTNLQAVLTKKNTRRCEWFIEQELETTEFTSCTYETCSCPCHTGAVERGVKSMTEVLKGIVGEDAWDGHIRSRIKNWLIMPSFTSKARCTRSILTMRPAQYIDRVDVDVNKLRTVFNKWNRPQNIVRLVTHFSYFAGISRMSLQNTPRNTKHSLHTVCISCEFHVILMTRRNKPLNHLSFCANTNPGAKCCEMRKVERGMWNAKKVLWNTTLYTFHFLWLFSRISW